MNIQMTVYYFDSLEQYVITKPNITTYAIPGSLNLKISNILSDLLPSESFIDYHNGKFTYLIDSTKQLAIYELLLEIAK